MIIVEYIEKVKIKLPKTEKGVKNFFDSCKNRKLLIADVEEHHKKHLKKAKHDLERAIREFEDKCWDWTIVKAYYAIHHAGNALLSKKKNVFSKDHSCLIISLKFWNLIDEKLFEELSSIHERFSDVFSIDITFQLRKISQYDVDEWEKLNKEDAEKILDFAKKFIGYVESELID